MKNQYKYGIGFFCLVFICFLPVLAVAPIPPEPPPPSPYTYPYTYTLQTGYLSSGYVWYTHNDDGVTLNFRAAWFWLLSFNYDLDVIFYFTQAKCSELYLDYNDNSLWAFGYVNLYAYYTTGSREFLGSYERGSYTIDLDSSRTLDRIWFDWHETSGWWWERYVYIDYLVAMKV
jgi:hypothetical protein